MFHPPRTLAAITLVSLALALSAAAQLSANSGINSADTWITFDMAVQGNRTLNESAPIYNPATGQSSNTLSLSFNRSYHVEMGYDSSGALVVNMWPTGPAPGPGTDASEISMIRLAGGQVTVFDENGNPIPYVQPNSSAPLPVALQYLGSNPGASVIGGLVIPYSTLPTDAAAIGGTLSAPPANSCDGCKGGSTVIEMSAPMSAAHGGTMQWWYGQSNGYDVAEQVMFEPNITNGSAVRSLTFSNVTWNDNSANDQARANRGSTATTPPAPSSPSLSSPSPSSPGPEEVYNDGGPLNLVLQHGLFGSGSTWDIMYPWLLDDFRLGTVVIPSLNWPDPLADQGQELIGDLNAVAQGNFLVVGYSQGGLIARYAAQYYQGQPGTPKISGVLTLDTPNTGAPLAVTGFVAADAAITSEVYQFLGDGGCLSSFSGFGCYAGAAAFVGAAALTDFGAYSAIPALADLIPGSNFLNTLNAATENFQRAAVIGESEPRWLPMRLGGDKLCIPESFCGGRAMVFYTQTAYAIFGIDAAVALGNLDFDQAEYWLNLMADMDAIDLSWNAMVGLPSDGVVPTYSQSYPASGVPQYLVGDADSHSGVTASDLDRAALDLALVNTFHAPTQSGCGFSVSPGSADVAVGGGGQDFTLYTSAGCGWSAVSSAPWLAPSSSQGIAQSTSVGLSFTAQANPTTTPREGKITLGNGIGASAVLSINEAGICDYTVSPSTVYEPSTGGGALIYVSPTNDECVWSAVPEATWLSVTDSTGTGAGDFNYLASPNSGGATLFGTIDVMGQPVSVLVGGTSGSSSTGTVTFGGSPQSKTVCGYEHHCTTYWNTGLVIITVNGYMIDEGFGEYTSAASMATAFATAMNSGGGPVHAAANGSVVTLTSVLHGTDTDYSMSVSSQWNSQDFGYPAFHAALSGATMTGGTN